MCEHHLRILFADALGEFVSRRKNAEAYVNKRYPDTPDYAWLNRTKKIGEVCARVQVAESLHDSVLSLNVTEKEFEDND